MAAETLSKLPWSCIFIFFDGDHRTYESLSLVSKQFLSITNRLRFCFTITNRNKTPYLPYLFHRFPNLKSLNLVLSCKRDDFDDLLIFISTFPLSNIKSLYLSNPNSNIPAKGLQALSKRMQNLTSLTCSRMFSISKNDLFFIPDCFPLLEELELSDPVISVDFNDLLDDDYRLSAFSKLPKINLSASFFNRQSINYLSKNCEFLQNVIVIDGISLRKRLITLEDDDYGWSL